MKQNTKCRLKVGDNVKVIAGKYKGEISTILKINKKDQTVIVKNINVSSRHISSKSKNNPGEIKRIEQAIHISNLMFWDPVAMFATKIRFKQKLKKESNKFYKIRYKKKDNQEININ